MLWLTKKTVRPDPAIVLHLPEALALERRVADRQDLVDEQDLGLEVRGHGEGQAHVHAGGVALDRRVEEPAISENSTMSSNLRRSPPGSCPRMAPLR